MHKWILLIQFTFDDWQTKSCFEQDSGQNIQTDNPYYTNVMWEEYPEFKIELVQHI